ncbi:MAG: T9SS type A sorting domain-containing protein, partial [Ferruginibacter sp.]|nr:T9SS type A sorting domain-containing protein [Ferruginibacter sp.]
LLYGAINSVINTNSNLTLLSRDTATARFGPLGTGNNITGQVTIERYLPARKSWRLLAAPVANGSSPFISASWREGGSTPNGYGTRITGPASFLGVDEFTQRASMKFYNGVTNNYVDVNNTNTTRIGNTNTGYYVFVRGDRSVAVSDAAAPTILRIKGDIQKGAQSVAVPAGRFVTLGNPYPSGINFKTVVKSNISNTFYVWNPTAAGSYNVGAFENYTLSAGEYRRVPGGTIRNTIQSGEAIFIQSNGAAGSVTVNETDKVGGITTPVSRSSSTVARVGNTTPTLEINMYTKDVDGSIYLADGILMNFDDNYSARIDNEDVRKISNAGDNFSVKNEANLLIVERRPYPKVADTIKFNLTNTRVNPYRFEIDPSALDGITLNPLLKDKFLGIEMPISLTGVTNYNFDITAAAASRVADRFMIVFKQIPPTRFTKITAVRNVDNTATVKWYTENENNINSYSIEHSTDGVNFKPLETQLPTANNFGNPYYDYLHTAATAGNNWYRVKANAIAGAAQFTDIVKLDAVVVVEKPSLSIYPNPIKDGKVNFYFKNKLQGMYEIRIINSAGQIILTERVSVNSLNFVKHLQVNAAAGLYSCTITDTNEQTQTETLIIK